MSWGTTGLSHRGDTKKRAGKGVNLGKTEHGSEKV